MDVKKIREDFPILKTETRGKKLVYLDNSATTQRPVQVIEAINNYYRRFNSNVHRGVYYISEEATKLYEEARAKVAKFINAENPRTIIFTRNTTEAINLVAYSWGRENIKEGDEIILTEMEHHSNLIPWQLLAREKNAKLKFIPVNDNGLLEIEKLSSLLTHETKILALTHVSNVLGTINLVDEIIKTAHDNGTIVLIDGAQSVPHMPVDVKKMDCDFLAFSGHKMLGPMGIGVLYGKEKILDEIPPFLGGGEMISQVWLDRATWNEIPWKFEAGTPNVEGAIGLGAAIDYLESIGMEKIREEEKKLTAYAMERIKEIEGIKIYGPLNSELKSGVISFNFENIHPHDVGSILDYEGVAVRVGTHCAEPLMRRFKTSAMVRASFYIYNIFEEIDIMINALKKVKEIFRGIR
ncbi:MAG: cysteine desulfurase [Candidatus Aminicenantia bacterium]